MPGLRRVGGSLLILSLSVGVAAPAGAQNALVRGAAIQPVALAKRGNMLVGLGAVFQRNLTIPLLDARGDLASLGIVQFSWALADGLVLSVAGAAFNELIVDTIGEPLVAPDEGLADGKSWGAGDFSVDMSFRALGDGDGLAVGGRFRFYIPSSNQAEGLGTNTTDIRMTLLASYGQGPLLVSGDIGVGILEAPLENFEQNDVLVYSAELLWRLGLPKRVRLYAGVYGRASTRNRIPVGTEDIGDLTLGVDLRLGSWLFDVRGLAGYAGNSGDWGVGGGVALLVGGGEDELVHE